MTIEINLFASTSCLPPPPPPRAHMATQCLLSLTVDVRYIETPLSKLLDNLLFNTYTYIHVFLFFRSCMKFHQFLCLNP